MPQASHAYAYGRVRVLENTLLTSDKLKRVLDAKSGKDALKALVEIGYGAGEQVTDVYDYEKLIQKDLETAYAFVHEVTPEAKVTDLFFYRYDYHNVKVLIKAEILKEEAEDMLIPYGTIEIDKLKRALKEDADKLDLPQEMVELIDTYKNDATLEAAEIGYLADGALYKQIARELKKIKNQTVKQYFNAQVDYNNVLSLLRSRALGDASLINKAYLPLGIFTVNDLYNAFNYTAEDILNLVRKKDADKGLITGMEYFCEKGSMSLIEKNKDNYFIAPFKAQGSEPLEIGPVLGYLLAKEQQANIIRLIMVAKINDLPTESVLERLRDLYE